VLTEHATRAGRHAVLICLVLAGMLLPAACSAIPGNTAVGKLPTAPQAPEPIPWPQGVATAMAFADQAHGWMGGSGFILRTTDGGFTWYKDYQGEARVIQIEAVDANHAWALTSSYGLLRREAAGWTAVPLTQQIHALDFVDATTGFAVSGIPERFGSPEAGHLLKTTDGGKSWEAVNTPLPVEDVSFADAEHGWALFPGTIDKAPRLLYTADGGRGWQSLAIPDEKLGFYTMFMQAEPGGVLWVVRGSDQPQGEGYALYRVTAAGQRWDPVLGSPLFAQKVNGTIPVGPLLFPVAASFPDVKTARLAVTCAQCGLDQETGMSGMITVVGTRDGGVTWSQSVLPILGRAASDPILMASWGAETAWILVRGTLLFKTPDAGKLWYYIYP